MQFPTFKFETEKITEGLTLIAGCDEVGVAPLAGPVVAAAVILDPSSISGKRSKSKWWYRVRDSKTINEKEREILVEFIKEHCLAESVGVVSHATVDTLNIYHASKLAMQHAIEGLKLKPEIVFIDGPRPIKNLQDIKQVPVIDGDAKILSISAASIIAKVCRDKILSQLHEKYPAYNFHLNKGYPTRFHREALVKFGPSEVHRKSFNLVKQLINQA